MYAFRRHLLKLPTFRQSLHFTDKAGGDKCKTEKKPDPKKTPAKPQAPPKPLKMSIIPYKEIHIDEDFFEHNARMGRSYSPHMTIYEPQLTSVLSYLHRICGFVVSGYVSGLGLAAVVFPNDMLEKITLFEELQLSGAILMILKLMITLPFSFHLTNGIRHLVWDSGRCLTIPLVYKTGYAAMGIAAALSAALAMI